jgi:hypothetical protein
MSETTFDRGAAACLAHATREGHLHVPVSHTEAGIPLNAWIRSRRREHRNGLLREDRRVILEGIPHWSWEASPRKGNGSPTHPFRRGVAAVRFYVERGGTLTDIPKIATVDEVNISRWVSRHRAMQRQGLLSAKHLAALDTIPGWGVGATSSDMRWETGMRYLRSYAAENGHTRVQNREVTSDGFLLGRFVSEARGAYRKGVLPVSRATALQSLAGWEWAAKRGRPQAVKR